MDKTHLNPVNGPVIPDNEMLVTDGTLYTGKSQMDIMMVSVDFNPAGSNHDLALTVGDYYGLETSRQVIKGYVDSTFSVVKGWANDNNQLYVVANTTKSLTAGEPGLFISKWEATTEATANTYQMVKESRGWSDNPFYSKITIGVKDKEEYKIIGVDPQDANYASRAELIGKTINIQEGGLVPYRSSYWFAGDVKVGKKKYSFTHFAIAKTSN